MKVLVSGMAKSGTSVLTYRVAAALPIPVEIAFEPSNFGQGRGEDESIHRELTSRAGSVVCKSMITPRDVESIELLIRCSNYYDKKIFIVRDPRDRELSGLLYRFHWRHCPEIEERRVKFLRNYESLVSLLEKKEESPASVSFGEMYAQWMSMELCSQIYRNMPLLLRMLDLSWCVFRYEDMIDSRFESLSKYLGYEVTSSAEVPDHFGRVVRSKAKENWRNWYLSQDVAQFKPVFEEYLRAAGYDADDWELRSPETLDPALGSEYVKRLYLDRNW